LTCALGVIIRAAGLPERWCIVGSTEKKAKIIMNYVIKHVFDSELFYTKLTVDTPLERLKHRLKERLRKEQKDMRIFRTYSLFPEPSLLAVRLSKTMIFTLGQPNLANLPSPRDSIHKLKCKLCFFPSRNSLATNKLSLRLLKFLATREEGHLWEGTK
jgi:hypothetical protein